MTAKRTFFVYITMSRSCVLYTGVTNDIERRIYEHKAHAVPGFTARYNVTRLVYFEQFERAWDAIEREKQIKNWSRAKKFALVRRANPKFLDLSAEWGEGWRHAEVRSLVVDERRLRCELRWN